MDLQETIESIYQAYPRKVARPKAHEAIRKALKKIDAKILLERVEKYAEHAQTLERQFIPHPSTWFNQERWDDYEDWQALSEESDVLSETDAWLVVAEAAKQCHQWLDFEEMQAITDCVPEPAKSIARRIGWLNVLDAKSEFLKLYREAVN